MQQLLRFLRIVICAAVTLTATVSARASGDSGVVAVYAQLGGKGGQGTGFLMSPSGEVVTAYHVIYGAQRIDVSWRGVHFNDVLILRIRPDRDLAVLRIANPPADMQPLPLAKQASNWSAGQSIQVLGHPRGLPLQQFNGTVTQKGFFLSEQLRNDRGRPLFREDGIRLVPGDVTIYSGLSGGPIFLGNEVIGVLSGSFDVGRGISWGIPVDYLRSMQEIGRRAGEIGQWPEFVMTADWSNVRAMHRLNAGVQGLLDEYFDNVDQLETQNKDLLVKLYKARALLVGAIQLFTAPSGTSTGADWWPGANAEQLVEKQLVPAVEQVGGAFNRSGEIESRVLHALGRLLSQKKELYRGLPRTLKNLQAVDETNAAETGIFQRYERFNKEVPQIPPKLAEAVRNMQPVGEIPSQGKSRLAQVLCENWRLLDDALKEQVQLKAVDERNARLQRYRDIGQVLEEVFLREQDLASDELQYRSSLGYTITMPRGWVPASQELLQLDLFHGIQMPRDADLSFLKTGFFGEDRGDVDLVFTMQVSHLGPSGVPFTDEALAHLREVLLSSQLGQLPDVREVSVRRASFGSRSGVLARAVWGPEQALGHFQEAAISLPNRVFFVVCYIRPGGDPSDCDAIIKSARFE